MDNVHRRVEALNEKIKKICRDQAYNQILDSMGGSDLQPALREKKLEDLKKGNYDELTITIDSKAYKTRLPIEGLNFPRNEMTEKVKQVFKLLSYSYEKMIQKDSYDTEEMKKIALKSVEEDGIIFIDQIDKLAVMEHASFSKGVSTEGVQRDLLPIIEGTTVNTKIGDIKTDHILFIASGSFSMAKIEDLIPELLGRLPIRVNLSAISRVDLERILREPEYNLLIQETKLMESEKITLKFTDEAISEMAFQAYEMNMHTQNLGARRLQAIIQKVMEEISFTAPNHKGQTYEVTGDYVREKLKNELKLTDLKQFLI